MTRKKLMLILALLPAMLTATAASMVGVTNLRTEMRTDPTGIATQSPMLSWELTSTSRGVTQQTYRIIVASTAALLDSNTGDLWDSHTVKSDRQNYVAYEGLPLKSGQTCYWKVMVKTNRGRAESRTAKWQNALLDDSEWQATWIGRNYPTDAVTGNTKVRARYLRKEFSVGGNVAKATLYICGLGLYEAYMNGKRVGNAVLAPTPTDYNHSVRYNTYDVTNQVNNGGNAIGVVLGNGRYVAMRVPGILHFGLPQLLAQLEIITTDGRRHLIVTDTSWKITSEGPIGNNNEYDGEEYDSRRRMPGWDKAGFDDSSWQQAEAVAAPKGKLMAQVNPNIRVMDKVRPVSVTEQRPGVYIVDMGQNMVGWLRFRLHGSEGDTLRMHFAETLQKDGSLYTANLRSAETTDTYIHNGLPAVWEPSFTYHGFRYVELTGFRQKPSLADIEGQIVYDEMATTGTFASSNAMLDRIYHNAFRGIRGNYRGMPTDCPQRDERMGWLGDRAMGAQGECYMFDNHLMYAKWLQDIEETMRPDSVISDVAPRYWSVDNDDVTWPSAWFTVADMLYEHYGDVRPIQRHYAAMKKWMRHIKSRYMRDNIVMHDTYGDWCMPPERPELIHSEDPARKTDGALLSTVFYSQLAKLMAKFAALSGNDADTGEWTALAEATQKAFMNKFYDRDKGCFGNNTVTANILPLRMGLLAGDNAEAAGQRQRVFGHIVEKTMGDFNGHVSTGLIGIQQLMRGLTDGGRGDLALQIATNNTYPSWGYMVDKGATTIWELWNGDTADPAMNSGNHVMLLGDLIIWCYNYLAGIGQTEGSVGYKTVSLKPRFIPGLDSAAGTFHSIYGTVTSSWTRTGNGIEWHFDIPCNTTAEVYVPAKVKKVKDGKYLRTEGDCAVFLFKSGTYDLSF